MPRMVTGRKSKANFNSSIRPRVPVSENQPPDYCVLNVVAISGFVSNSVTRNKMLETLSPNYISHSKQKQVECKINIFKYCDKYYQM